MGKLKTKTYYFNEKTGEATYIYKYKNQEFVGKAFCSKEDKDFCSELLGIKIAELRAYVKYLKVKKEDLKNRLSTLEGVVNNMKTSKDFDITSNYGKKLQFSICDCKRELQEVKRLIKEIPKSLDMELEQREDFYNKIRNKRK
ncbi:MAG: hypothetical protein HUJ68_04950 [Clostridia bacterium]|nr:hypothetical protein [Clostridia bacterium]